MSEMRDAGKSREEWRRWFHLCFFLLFIYLLIFLNRFSGLFCGVVRFGLEV